MNCPRCAATNSYQRSSTNKNGWGRYICRECRHHFSQTSGTTLRAAKKPAKWYSAILDMYLIGMSACSIKRKLKMKDTKSIYYFLLRWRAELAATID